MKVAHVVATIVVCGVLATGCRKGNEAQRTTSARVDYVNGVVTINGTPAEPGATIAPVFTVVTDVDSSVGIVFDVKNILHVDAQTEAYIDLTTDVRTVELRRGTLASALRRLSQAITDQEDRFRVKTPSAVAGVRGTVFFVRVEDPATSYVCTCNGRLHLRDSRDANPFLVQAEHHVAYRFVSTEGANTATPAPMLYHTDRMMELGAARIGETIDWTKVGP